MHGFPQSIVDANTMTCALLNRSPSLNACTARPRLRIPRRPRSPPSLQSSLRQRCGSLVVFVQLLVVFSNLAAPSGVVIAPRNCKGSVKHVTIAVGPDPSTSMIVTFASIPSQFEAPVGGVLLGTSPTDLTQLVLEQEPPTHYSLVSPHHGSKSRYYSSFYHHVTISGLEPSATYYYRPVVQATVKAFDKYKLLRHQEPNSAEKESEDGQSKQQLLRDFEAAVEDDELDVSHRHLILGPYDGSQKECPSPDRIRSFRTGPVPGSESTANFAICGDVGQFPHSEELVTRMLRSRDDIDVMVLAGDIAYASLDHRRWDTFQDFLDDYPIAEHVPLMLVPGNHDIEKQVNDTEIFLAYEHRFRMPRVHPPVLGKFDGPPGLLNMDHPPYPLPYEWGNAYYAFTYGPARVVMISAYSSMEPNSTQYHWIVSELESVDRTVTPWVLAVLHTPLYNTFSVHQRDYQIVAARENLEPLFVEHKVNMVFTGHIHAYLRTTAVVRGQVDPRGPVHITVGAGGRKCEAPFLNPEPEPWVEVRDATAYGYGMFRIVNRTHAEWDWVHTGHNDDREYNQLYHSNTTLPAGPGRDRLVVVNQYYL